MSQDSQIAARKSDQELVQELMTMKSQELSILTRSLVYLNEVFNRKLDLKMGNDSLYTFAERVLGFSKDEAYPRIRAAEVLRFAPKFEDHLREGRISMSALKHAQVSFRAENARRKKERVAKLENEEKLAILNEILESSTRQAARVLAEQFPQLDRDKDQERMRPISRGRQVFQIVLEAEDCANLQQLKEFTAHSNPEGKNGVVIALAVRRALKQELAKRTPKEPRAEKAKTAKAAQAAKPPIDVREPVEHQLELPIPAPVVTRRKRRAYISVHVKRAVHEKSGRQCMYVSPEGVRCQCRYGVQGDHAWPKSLGGTDDLDDMQLLCRAHNGFQAWEMGLRPPPHVDRRF